MKHLLPLLKKIEVHLRANQPLPPTVLEEIAELPQWDYEIVVDFMNRVDFFVRQGIRELAYKVFERWSNEKYRRYPNAGPKRKEVDLVIASLRRDALDVVLTDIKNHLPVPGGVKHDILEIWGMPVTRARNFAVEQACRMGAKLLFFIDDDVIAPVGTLYQLYETMLKTGAPAVAGNYYRKTEPLRSAHSTRKGEITPEDVEKGGLVEIDGVLAMGCTLINLYEVAQKVPFPLFWEFVSPDGFWALGEDAFFTKLVLEYMDKKPVVDLSVDCLHYDKRWHRCYGIRRNDVTYAVNNQFLDAKTFERVRVPPSYPNIVICIPLRHEKEPIACDIKKLKTLRGYRSEVITVTRLPVDQAREALVEEAIKRNADYVLFLDNDIIPPDHGLCLLQEAIELPGVDIVVGDYPLKGKPTNSIHLVLDPAKDGMVTELDRAEALEKHPQNKDLVRCNWVTGLGFALIKVHVFKQLRKPWFKCHNPSPINPEEGINEDAHFCELANQAGFGIWVHTGCRCLHVDFTKAAIYSLGELDDDYATSLDIASFDLK